MSDSRVRHNADRYDKQRSMREISKRQKREKKSRRRDKRRDKKMTDYAGWQGHGSCGRKKQYTKKQVDRVAGFMGRLGKSVHPYRCSYCGRYHLTSKPWPIRSASEGG